VDKTAKKQFFDFFKTIKSSLNLFGFGRAIRRKKFKCGRFISLVGLIRLNLDLGKKLFVLYLIQMEDK
jgi:hypothetical protein